MPREYWYQRFSGSRSPLLHTLKERWIFQALKRRWESDLLCGSWAGAGKWPVNGQPAFVRGRQPVVEAEEVTSHPHDKQIVGPLARDGW